MITSLKIKFGGNAEIVPNSRLASVFHGVMMELISVDYAEYLHLSQVHPYSQYITGENNCIVWNINTLDKNSAENISSAHCSYKRGEIYRNCGKNFARRRRLFYCNSATAFVIFLIELSSI